MAATDNLHIPDAESIRECADRKGIRTEKQKEVEEKTKGEEEYVPSTSELASALLIEKIAESDDEDVARPQKRKGLFHVLSLIYLIGCLNSLVLSTQPTSHTPPGCYPGRARAARASL